MIEKIRQNLRQILGELEIHGEIMGRRKHAYSIYKKLISKHENIDDIYDLVALRVLVDTLPECYAVLGKSTNFSPQFVADSKTILQRQNPMVISRFTQQYYLRASS